MTVSAACVCIAACGGAASKQPGPSARNAPPLRARSTSSAHDLDGDVDVVDRDGLTAPPQAPTGARISSTDPSAPAAGLGRVQKRDGRALGRGEDRCADRRRFAFFPKGAYAQVKAIADPGADYEAPPDRRVPARPRGRARTARRGRAACRPAQRRCAGVVRALGSARSVPQPDWLLRGTQLKARLRGSRANALVRNCVADLLARRLVRGSPRRRHPIGRWRRGRRSERRARLAGRVLDLLRGGAAVLGSESPKRLLAQSRLPRYSARRCSDGRGPEKPECPASPGGDGRARRSPERGNASRYGRHQTASWSLQPEIDVTKSLFFIR